MYSTGLFGPPPVGSVGGVAPSSIPVNRTLSIWYTSPAPVWKAGKNTIGAVIAERFNSPLAVSDETGKSITSHDPEAVIPGIGSSPEMSLPLSTFIRKPPERLAAPETSILISKDRLPEA